MSFQSVTSVLFYFGQADRQHPQTGRVAAEEPGWQSQEPTGGEVRGGPHGLQASDPGNSDLYLLHIFRLRVVCLLCQNMDAEPGRRWVELHLFLFPGSKRRTNSLMLAVRSSFGDSSVTMLSHTKLPVRDVADRWTSTSTPASICRYSRTPTCSVNGPFFSSSTGWWVFKLWRTQRRPATVNNRHDRVTTDFWTRTKNNG